MERYQITIEASDLVKKTAENGAEVAKRLRYAQGRVDVLDTQDPWGGFTGTADQARRWAANL